MIEYTLTMLPKPIRIQYETLIVPLNKNISHNVQEGGIQTRPSLSNGLWCQFLLPSVLCMYVILEDVTLLYKISTYLSLGLLTYCSLFILFLSLSSLVVKEPVYGGFLASSFISTLLLYGILKQNLLFSFIISSATVLSFVWILRQSLIKLPKTFTIGEGMIVNQSVILFTFISLVNWILESPERDYETFFIYAIVSTVLVAVSLMIVVLFYLNDILRNMRSLIQIIATGATMVLITLHFVIGVDFVNKIMIFIFFTGYRAAGTKLATGGAERRQSGVMRVYGQSSAPSRSRSVGINMKSRRRELLEPSVVIREILLPRDDVNPINQRRHSLEELSALKKNENGIQQKHL